MVKRAIRQYYQDKLQSDTGDPAKVWKAIIMNKPKKDTKISALGTDDNEPIDLTQIPNAFNKYFIELGDELCNDIPPSVSKPEVTLWTLNVQQIHGCISKKYLKQKF